MIIRLQEMSSMNSAAQNISSAAAESASHHKPRSPSGYPAAIGCRLPAGDLNACRRFRVGSCKACFGFFGRKPGYRLRFRPRGMAVSRYSRREPGHSPDAHNAAMFFTQRRCRSRMLIALIRHIDAKRQIVSNSRSVWACFADYNIP